MEEHEVWALLSNYIDGTLSPKEKTAVESHLATCQRCRHEQANLEETKELLRGLPRIATPPQLLSKLEQKYLSPSWPLRVLNWFVQPFVWKSIATVSAVVLFVVVFVGIKISQRNDEIPLEPLLAAHTRYNAETLVPSGDIVDSGFSGQLAAYYEEKN